MDFKNYYNEQAKNDSLNVYRGAYYQRGYGFGDIFRKFFRWIVPIVKKNATPVLKTVGKELVNTASTIANETIEGKNFRDSFNENVAKTVNNIHDLYGKGYKKNKKRKKNYHKSQNKKFKDIFG